MKWILLILIGVLMFAGAVAMSIYGPDLSDGQNMAVFMFGLGGVVIFMGGLTGLGIEI